MKIIQFVFFVIIFFPSIIIIAQQKNGMLSIGGEIGYSRHSNIEEDAYGPYETIITKYTLNPKLGYFLSDNFEIGLGLSYSHSENETKSLNDDYVNKGNMFSVNPFARYYGYFNENFGIFLELNLLYGFGDEDYRLYPSRRKYDVKHYSIMLNPGIIYSLSDLISIDASVRFFQYEKVPDQFEITDIGIDFKTVALGVRVNI